MTKKKILRLLFFIFAALCGVSLIIWLRRNPSPQATQVEVVSNKNLEQVSNKNLEPILDKTVEKDEKLQTQTDSLLPLFDNMPPTPVYLKDEAILKSGNEAQLRVAYAICENKKPTIFVKKIFYQKANQKQLVNILKHELTHAWFCRQGIKAEHDARFRKKFESIGGFGN